MSTRDEDEQWKIARGEASEELIRRHEENRCYRLGEIRVHIPDKNEFIDLGDEE